jgi:hypothetical protein
MGAKRLPNDDLQGEPVRTITRPITRIDEGAQTIQICDVHPVGSYNWVDTGKPTIIVPGMTAHTCTVVVSSQHRRGTI